VFALDLHAEIVLVIGGFMNLLAGGAMPVASDLFPHATPVVHMLLSGLSPFGIWYIAVLTLGTAVVTGMSRTRAAGTVFLAYGAAAVGNTAVLVTVIDRFHLLR
jgi:hypothetical protein